MMATMLIYITADGRVLHEMGVSDQSGHRRAGAHNKRRATRQHLLTGKIFAACETKAPAFCCTSL